MAEGSAALALLECGGGARGCPYFGVRALRLVGNGRVAALLAARSSFACYAMLREKAQPERLSPARRI
jgi:hypothetical protein